MSNISPFVNARLIDDKAILLNVNYAGQTLILFGSTLKTSALPHTELRQFTIYPKPGESGIVALTLRHEDSSSKRGSVNYWPTFVEVKWKDGKPVAELSRSWGCAERIGQVTQSGVEVVLPNGKRVASHEHYGLIEREKRPLHAPDGDLLCRYLWGTAKAHEVLHAVVQQELEPTRQRIVEDLNSLVKDLGKRLTAATKAGHDTEQALVRERQNARDAQFSLSALVYAFDEDFGVLRAWGNCISPILDWVGEKGPWARRLLQIPDVQERNLIVPRLNTAGLSNRWLLSKLECGAAPRAETA